MTDFTSSSSSRRDLDLPRSGQSVNKRGDGGGSSTARAHHTARHRGHGAGGAKGAGGSHLELAAYGRYQGHPRGANAAISAAESAVRQHDAQRRAAAKEEAERPWLVVHFDFRGPGGRSFTVGRQRIDPALADELREWQETKEAVAEQRGWDAPSGFNTGNWPPFSIEGGAAEGMH